MWKDGGAAWLAFLFRCRHGQNSVDGDTLPTALAATSINPARFKQIVGMQAENSIRTLIVSLKREMTTESRRFRATAGTYSAAL